MREADLYMTSKPRRDPPCMGTGHLRSSLVRPSRSPREWRRVLVSRNADPPASSTARITFDSSSARRVAIFAAHCGHDHTEPSDASPEEPDREPSADHQREGPPQAVALAQLRPARPPGFASVLRAAAYFARENGLPRHRRRLSRRSRRGAGFDEQVVLGRSVGKVRAERALLVSIDPQT